MIPLVAKVNIIEIQKSSIWASKVTELWLLKSTNIREDSVNRFRAVRRVIISIPSYNVKGWTPYNYTLFSLKRFLAIILKILNLLTSLFSLPRLLKTVILGYITKKTTPLNFKALFIIYFLFNFLNNFFIVRCLDASVFNAFFRRLTLNFKILFFTLKWFLPLQYLFRAPEDKTLIPILVLNLDHIWPMSKFL